jgi:glycosyltransferase involved in cell wall biosynthesis
MTSISALLMINKRGERLAYTLESIYQQTRLPDQLVIVINGADSEQENIIAVFTCDDRIRDVAVVRLADKQGVAAALNAGLAQCSGEWIMLVGNDNLSLPDRAQLQLNYVLEHPDVHIVGSWVENAMRIKASPISHNAIMRALRATNALDHSSVLLRREKLHLVDGYKGDFTFLEDWHLWVRLGLAGARFAVIPKVLVRALGEEEWPIRGGWQHVFNKARFRLFCWAIGFTPFYQYAICTLSDLGFVWLGRKSSPTRMKQMTSAWFAIVRLGQRRRFLEQYRGVGPSAGNG